MTDQLKPKNLLERNQVIVKLGVLGFLVLLLLIPIAMIEEIIDEREGLHQSVREEISQKYGGVQHISGPFITIPYITKVANDDNIITQTQYIHLLPEDLKIAGVIDTGIRRRHIYKLLSYSTDLEFKGSFDLSALRDMQLDSGSIHWNQAVMNFGISDLKGIKDRVELQWDGTSLPFKPGMQFVDPEYSGISRPLPMPRSGIVDFSFKLNLKGSEGLYFLPVAKNTEVALQSTCPNPSFNGNYLPEYTVSPEGFSAKWKILELNRNFPQLWLANSQHQWPGNESMASSAFGLDLMLDVGHYQKTTRTVKYALLLIALTFLTFFFMEVLNTGRVHPVQYTLIGLVMAVFYILLLSLSEQFGFDWAYWISTTAVIALIMVYMKPVLKSAKLTFLLFAVLAIIYTFIYIIIQLTSYNLLFGSVGLFIFLGTIMIQSRKIDWYALGNRKEQSVDN